MSACLEHTLTVRREHDLLVHDLQYSDITISWKVCL